MQVQSQISKSFSRQPPFASLPVCCLTRPLVTCVAAASCDATAFSRNSSPIPPLTEQRANAIMSNSAIHRITKELTNIQKACDLSLAVACRDSDVRSLRALIIGPPDTPYEFGFFEFDVKFPKDYPLKSPHVKCITTNGGRTRFNPNIYAEGKVCLSILGTWRGNPGEEWSSAQGLESVLISVQSLMSVNPYGEIAAARVCLRAALTGCRE